MKSVHFVRFASASLVLAATACGSSTGVQGASVSGTFAGQPLDALDSASFSGTSTDIAFLSEIIASTPGVCSAAQDHVAQANGTRLELVVQSFGGGSPKPIAPGKYTITHGDPAVDANGNFLLASAQYNALDASCQPTIADTTSSATSGSITVTSLSASMISGRFDLVFPNGDELTGNFSSPVCSDQAPPDAPTPTPAPVAAGGATPAASAPASCGR